MNETPDTAQRPAQPVVATGPLLGAPKPDRKWSVQFGFATETGDHLFSSEGMPRKEAEILMDAVEEDFGVGAWLNDRGPASPNTGDEARRQNTNSP